MDLAQGAQAVLGLLDRACPPISRRAPGPEAGRQGPDGPCPGARESSIPWPFLKDSMMYWKTGSLSRPWKILLAALGEDVRRDRVGPPTGSGGAVFSAGQKRPGLLGPLSGALFSMMSGGAPPPTPRLRWPACRYSLRATGSGTFSISLTTARTTLAFSSGTSMRTPAVSAVDQEIEAGNGLLHQPEVRSRPCFLRKPSGSRSSGRTRTWMFRPFLEAQGDGPGAGVPPGRVPVVVDDEPRGEAHGLGDLLGRQGRSQRGDDVE